MTLVGYIYVDDGGDEEHIATVVTEGMDREKTCIGEDYGAELTGDQVVQATTAYQQYRRVAGKALDVISRQRMLIEAARTQYEKETAWLVPVYDAAQEAELYPDD